MRCYSRMLELSDGNVTFLTSFQPTYRRKKKNMPYGKLKITFTETTESTSVTFVPEGNDLKGFLKIFWIVKCY